MTVRRDAPSSWRPGASFETLRSRAELLKAVRAFFANRGVLEVDTPQLSAGATVDRHIESYRATPAAGTEALWLHTSPEFAMKRLLAAGSGPIYQLCHVFRAGEAGRWHNPEFMMLEWYRPGWDHHELMGEVEALLHCLGVAPGRRFPRLTYAEAFQSQLDVDPFAADVSELRAALQRKDRATVQDSPEGLDRDGWLDLCMSTGVGPALGHDVPLFVYDFPASQAALAQLRPDNPGVAERFELFWQGVELANGFHELRDAEEQRRRFLADLDWRRRAERPTPPCDQRLLAALVAGLPACAGVAMGMDRLLMLLLGLSSMDEVVPFSTPRA